MRKIFTVLMLLIAIAGFAQKKKKKDTPAKAETTEAKPAEKPVAPVAVKPADSVNQNNINPLIEHYVRKYSLASRWGDQAAVKDALYDLIAETENDSLAYTLAVYYYEHSQFAPTVLITKDLLQRTPKNVSLLQLSGAGYEGLGLRAQALPSYESIYLINGGTAVLYKMITLQYETKRYPECKANIDIILTKTDLDSLKVQENDGKDMKEYPLRAAIANVRGLLAEQTGDKTGARKFYQDALVIAPGFQSAKQNLAKLK